jgi:Zn-dependent protease/predicted transcriptional regulator
MHRTTSFKIFQIFGIEIRIDYSWFIIFALIAYFFGFSYFPSILPNTKIYIIAIITIISALLFFFSILFHEVSHSVVAIKNKIPVKRITLFVFGGIAQIEKEPDSAQKEFLISIAGPLSSYFLALIFGLIWFFTKSIPEINEPAKYLALTNIILGTFNLLPGFPLDGGRVLRSILWKSSKDYEKATLIATNVGRGIGFAIILWGVIYLFTANFFNGIWLIFIGWFLQSSASQSYSQIIIEKSLKGIKVKDVINTNIVTAPANITVKEFVDNWFMKYPFGKFPVIDTENDDKYLGIVTLNDIKNLPQEKWDSTKVGEIVNIYIEEDKVDMDMELYDAMKKLNDANISSLVVVENSKIIGLLTKSDILKLIKVKSTLKI